MYNFFCGFIHDFIKWFVFAPCHRLHLMPFKWFITIRLYIYRWKPPRDNRPISADLRAELYAFIWNRKLIERNPKKKKYKMVPTTFISILSISSIIFGRRKKKMRWFIDFYFDCLSIRFACFQNLCIDDILKYEVDSQM